MLERVLNDSPIEFVTLDMIEIYVNLSNITYMTDTYISREPTWKLDT